MNAAGDFRYVTPGGFEDFGAESWQVREALVNEIGTGVANSGGWACAIRLAEKAGLSVWAAPYAARETFPETHKQFAGFLPAWRDQLRQRLLRVDAQGRAEATRAEAEAFTGEPAA
mgnify:CR=1 FL=1